jgi:hypothetical protein
VTESKLSNICGLILYVFVLIGPSKPEVEEEVAEHQFWSSLVHFSPPLYSPQEPNAVRRALQMDRSDRLEIDQNFDHFLTSIFGRFWVVLGCHLGVILGTFGGQDGPSSVQNAS